MRYYVNSASIELWKIIKQGYQAVDESNKTRREVVDCQLNATALDLIRDAVGEDDLSHIEHCTTAKEAWACLIEVYDGNESMKRNRFEEMSNKAEGFFMEDGEDHEQMFRRLKSLANAYKALGGTHVDDAWVKRKYVNAFLPFEGADLKSLQGRLNYPQMTSNEVMQEIQSFKVQAKIAQDSRARAIGM